MIRSFRCAETKRLFEQRHSNRFGQIAKVALRKLDQLDASLAPAELAIPPGNRLEALKGKRAGQYSIRINDQWRLCFAWSGQDATDVEIVDYH
jgi:proteic killer suppression protein